MQSQRFRIMLNCLFQFVVAGAFITSFFLVMSFFGSNDLHKIFLQHRILIIHGERDTIICFCLRIVAQTTVRSTTTYIQFELESVVFKWVFVCLTSIRQM